MYKKVCNRCVRNSYSSTETGRWICPSCGNDLTESPYYGITVLQPLYPESLKREKVINIYKNSVRK
jgi:ribosomal protein L37AE/L43A